MSEPIPESIPTSADPRSKRPLKKRALSPSAKHSANIEALFANPNKPNLIPAAPQAKTLAPPPEIVTNVQGSSAGAGSGEFHVYKASRRREGERLRMMDDEKEKEERDREWEEKNAKISEGLAKKTGKNAARRHKARQNKEMAKKNNGQQEDGVHGDEATKSAGLAPRKLENGGRNGDEGAEGDLDGQSADAALPGIIIHDDD